MNLADLKISRAGAVVVATLTGEVDMSNAESLRAAALRATPNDALALVLELSGIEYMDSAGIHMIYNLRQSLGSRGQTLWLVIPADSLIIDTLRLAGVDQHLPVAETLDQALEAARV